MKSFQVPILIPRHLVNFFLVAAAFNAGAAEEVNGETLFNQRCAKCHTTAKLAPALGKRPMAERQAYLETFLEKHFPPPVAQRKLIATYLAALSTK